MGRLRPWIPPAIWLALMWTFSTHYFTAEQTKLWIVPILHWLFPSADSAHLRNMHLVSRKVAHVFDYLILSILLVRAIRRGRPGWQFNWAVGAWGMAACYAVIDEVHQAFVPGRTGSWQDVLLDSAAAVLGQLVFWLYRRSSDAAPVEFEE